MSHFSLLEGVTAKAFRATRATCHCRSIPGSLLLLHPCCLFGLEVDADDAQDVSSLGKLWRAELQERLASLSPVIKHWPKVSAEWFLSQHGRSHKVQVHLHLW